MLRRYRSHLESEEDEMTIEGQGTKHRELAPRDAPQDLKAAVALVLEANRELDIGRQPPEPIGSTS
jgi:hypothetical protein